jgi:hypothetical protein
MGTFGVLGLSDHVGTGAKNPLRVNEQTTIAALQQTLDNYEFLVSLCYYLMQLILLTALRSMQETLDMLITGSISSSIIHHGRDIKCLTC